MILAGIFVEAVSSRGESKMRKELDKLSEELAELPRHEWDQRLWDFCEELLEQAGRPRHAVARPEAGVGPRSLIADSQERRADSVSHAPSKGSDP